MEVKVECGCGTKFKFEVEPINGRMPVPVQCPACGADTTEKANAFLRAHLAAPTPAKPAAMPLAIPSSSAPPTSPPPPAVMPSAPPRRARVDPGAPPWAPPIGSVAGIQAPPPIPTRAPATAPFPPPGMAAATAPAAPRAKSSSKGTLIGVSIAVLVVALGGFGAWKIGSKWYKGFKEITEMARADRAADQEASRPCNFWYEDAVVLFVKHTNHMEVAQTCQAYWKEQLHKNLSITDSSDPPDKNQYQLLPAHNGYVRIIGTLDWPVAQFEAVAQHLSKQFDTLVFEMQDIDFSGVYHFGVYEQGNRRFHAQLDVKITEDNVDETVTTEGNEWAIAHGYKPGPEGFQEFHLGDADEITQRMGMKLWDEEDGEELKGVLLKETTGRPK